MSTQALSAPISSLSPLLVQTQVARWEAATPVQLTSAHLHLDISKSCYLFHAVGNVMGWYTLPSIAVLIGDEAVFLVGTVSVVLWIDKEYKAIAPVVTCAPVGNGKATGKTDVWAIGSLSAFPTEHSVSTAYSFPVPSPSFFFALLSAASGYNMTSLSALSLDIVISIDTSHGACQRLPCDMSVWCFFCNSSNYNPTAATKNM